MAKLGEYERKRDFAKTPEPRPKKAKKREVNRRDLHFVIQKHDATRLHYDFRLEDEEGVLKSWAVPKGLSMDPSVKRLAIMTEDHPGDYIDFEGEIPNGNYGAGSVIVWDTGIYRSEAEIDSQIANGKVSFTLFGEKVKGSFSLVKTKRNSNQWLLIKSKDDLALSSDDLSEQMPQSVLSGRVITPKVRRGKVNALEDTGPEGTAKPFSLSVKPMLAVPVDEPPDKQDWVYEVKWDGVRAILFFSKSEHILRIKSRKGNEIAHRYPEVVDAVASSVKCNNSVVLDGEIVVLDKNGVPDFQRHQSRMNVDSISEIKMLAASSPATYYVFDILYLDGMNLEHLAFLKRREILSRVISSGISPSGKIRISEFIEGEGKEIFRNAIAMKLEGIVAKYKQSKYQQGSRSPAWLKIKGIVTQDCVVIGYTKGEGNRTGYFGSLILAANIQGKLRFVGHTGSGFVFDQLEETLKIMRPLIVDKRPIAHVPYVNREPVWLKPELVVEVKFSGWTQERIMRAPIFVRFRDDKRPEECIMETPKEIEQVVEKLDSGKENAKAQRQEQKVAPKSSASFSNLQKVYWPATASTGDRPLKKQDLLDYYSNISSFILPHLRDRPLSLSRYPDGIGGKHFYHKNWDKSRPDYLKSIEVFSESSDRIINYLLCNNAESLLWLANLGCIEMHPWYSRVRDFSACSKLASTMAEKGKPALEESKCGLEVPDFIVFDLDPYIYSGKEQEGEEPEYNSRGFKAAVEVAHELKELFDSLRIESFVKTSGKTGLHIFVPVGSLYTYDQTRAFAEIVGKFLTSKSSSKITMEWSTSKREGKVFFDHNQNAQGKTIASVLSARPSSAATVSMPLKWSDIDKIRPTDFTILNAADLIRKTGDPWQSILEKKQDLDNILQNASELAA